MLAIEALVERVRLFGRDAVSVLDSEWLAREGHTASETGTVQGKREIGVRQIWQGIVLGAQEVEGWVPLGVLLDQVQAARVTGGEPPGLGQDQIQNALGIALTHECHPDLVEFAELSGEFFELGARAGL